LKPQAEPFWGMNFKSLRFSSCPGAGSRDLKFARLLPTHCVGFWLRSALRAVCGPRGDCLSLFSLLFLLKDHPRGKAFNASLPAGSLIL
jgi:hypothetical protein